MEKDGEASVELDCTEEAMRDFVALMEDVGVVTHGEVIQIATEYYRRINHAIRSGSKLLLRDKTGEITEVDTSSIGILPNPVRIM